MLESIFDIVKYLVSDIASIAIICLATFELFSYLFFTRPSKKVRKQIIDILQLKQPLYLLSLLSWLILFVVAILNSHDTSRIPATFLTAGITVFFLGWSIRYPPNVIKRALISHRRQKEVLNYYGRLWTRLRLHINNHDLYGPWIEIIGITLISKFPVAIFAAVFLFPILRGYAEISKYKKLAAQNSQFNYPTVKSLIPMAGNIFSIVWLPFAVAIVVAITTRELTIFYGDFETAKSILFVLSQIGGSVGILAITIIFVLTQLTASNYSTRIPAILFRQPTFWIPLFILFASITYNLIIASRAAIYFPDSRFQNLLIDFSFVFSFAAALSIALFIARAPKMVSPESIIADSLKTFDKKWLDKVKQDWGSHDIVINVTEDPFVAIERILSRAIESGDSLTFVSGLTSVSNHLLYRINNLGHLDLADYIIEIDKYLRHHFRSLVRSAARNSDAHSLLMLIYFIKELGEPSAKSIERCKTFAFDPDDAAGELLLREILQQSIKYQLTECVRRSIYVIRSRAENVINTLPEQTDTWRFSGLGLKAYSETPEEERNRLHDNDWRIENFERQYVSYLKSVGLQAAQSKTTGIVFDIVYSVGELIVSITKEINGHKMKSLMVQNAVRNLSEISEAIISNRLSDSMTLGMLKYAIENVDTDQDEMVVWPLVNFVSEFLIKSSRAGLLDYINVVDSAMLGLKVAEKYTDPGIFLMKSMGEAAKLYKQNSSYADSKDMQLTYNELIRRIQQIAGHNLCKEPQRIKDTAKSVLGDLGEQ